LADRAVGRGIVGAAAVRLRGQLRPHSTGHRGGRAIPWPYGGKQRQVMIDLQSRSASIQGTVGLRHCRRRQHGRTDSSDRDVEDRPGSNTTSVSTPARRRSQELNDLPVKAVGNTTSTSTTWATCRDGFAPQKYRPAQRPAEHPADHHEDRHIVHFGHR